MMATRGSSSRASPCSAAPAKRALARPWQGAGQQPCLPPPPPVLASLHGEGSGVSPSSTVSAVDSGEARAGVAGGRAGGLRFLTPFINSAHPPHASSLPVQDTRKRVPGRRGR